MANDASYSPEQLYAYLDDHLVPDAVAKLNDEILPISVPLYADDALPTNQRNLTDVRTRIGILLEYEFGQAISSSTNPSNTLHGMNLTYVIANQFPDLAFRGADGEIGVRFEMKAIQATAEEKSANFSTMIKDIRKNTDFVIVLLWEWKKSEQGASSFPHIDAYFVLDAYQLAQMRDCYWLNSPPVGLTTARQGYDLEFGVNARAGSFFREEGNYGKLMRIFQSSHEYLLDASVLRSATLQKYHSFTEAAARLGLVHIGRQIAARATQDSGNYRTISETLPTSYLVAYSRGACLIVGNRTMPPEQAAMDAMTEYAADNVMIMNEKFRWRVLDKFSNTIARGNKPAQASEWFALA